MQKEEVIEQIRQAFAATQYPGDQFVQGSFEGCEPYEEVSAFIGNHNWAALDSSLLDQHYCALSFFSEGGFRFFLPAFLIADLRDELRSADPLFHLWHGFAPVAAEVPVGSVSFRRDSASDTLLNPRRYGAMTWSDYARHRLSVFTREEAKAIVAYLFYRRERDKLGLDAARIDAALKEFWLDRAANAPPRIALEDHLQSRQRFTAALERRHAETSGESQGNK